MHIAPGHGVDDYHVGKTHNLDIYCPVLGDGTYDTSVPDWLVGRSIWDANSDIVNQLSDSGHLCFSYEFNHSYPHDWRSKTPVILEVQSNGLSVLINLSIATTSLLEIWLFLLVNQR